MAAAGLLGPELVQFFTLEMHIIWIMPMWIQMDGVKIEEQKGGYGEFIALLVKTKMIFLEKNTRLVTGDHIPLESDE